MMTRPTAGLLTVDLGTVLERAGTATPQVVPTHPTQTAKLAREAPHRRYLSFTFSTPSGSSACSRAPERGGWSELRNGM